MIAAMPDLKPGDAMPDSTLLGADGPGLEPGKFVAPHGLALDSRGDIYVGEVSYTEWPRLFPEIPIVKRMRSLQKLKRVG